jgi:hypothetical protein
MTVLDASENSPHAWTMEAIKAHPWLTAATVVCSLGGVIALYALDPTGWGHGRKVLGGILAGVGVAYTIITTRMVGAWSEHDDSGD